MLKRSHFTLNYYGEKMDVFEMCIHKEGNFMCMSIIRSEL